MKKTDLISLIVAILLTTSCKTTETTETKPVTWEQQSAYLAKVKDPRMCGFSIYETPAGTEYRGGGRLHPNQIESLPMEVKDPARPVVMLHGDFGLNSPVLMDFCASSSVLEFDLAQKHGALPLGEREAQLVKMPDEEISGCISTVPSMRFKQLYIEDTLVYVRMATGPIGTLARGIEKPELKGVVGWDILRKFEQIQLDYSAKEIVLSTSKTAYSPNPAKIAAKMPLVKYTGACAVRGLVDGKGSLVLIDPAGDFEVATDNGAAISSIQMDAGLTFSAPAVAVSPGGTRIGARLLQNYKVVIRPQDGMVCFEKSASGKDK